jgi:hypothetical protein
MTSDFSLPPLSSPQTTSAPARSVDPAVLALQLLRPIDAQTLPPGQQAAAEVIRSTPQSADQFAVLLRIARGDGSGTLDVPVSSRQALPEGTQLSVQLVNQTRLLAVVQALGVAASEPELPITRLDPARFPPDSALSLRVLSQQQIPDTQRFELLARVLQGPASGTTVALQSERALEPGTLLQARVGAQGELRMAAAAEQQRQLALSLGLRDSLQRQAPPELLLQSLERLAGSPTTPESLLPAIRQVLMHAPGLAQLSTEAGVAQAIKQSGLFMENNLAMLANALKGGPSAQTSPTAGETPVQLPPLSKLVPLLAGLSTPPGAEPLPGADFKITLVNLLISLQQHLPPDTLKLMTLPTSPWHQALIAKPGGFPLPSRALQAMSETTDLGSLLRLAAALLSRIQHHQFQSLGQTQSFADGSSQTVWQLDIPMRDGPQQFNHVQVRIQRDDSAPSPQQPEPVPRWEVRLAFSLGELGNMQAIARLYKGSVSSEFWAERAQTVDLLDQELSQLRDRLLAKGLSVGELSCRQGTPPAPLQAVQQRWIDEVT